MKNTNPFKKGSLASLFFKIDQFLKNPFYKKEKVQKSYTFVKTIFDIIIIPLEIIFIFIKLIFQILWIITIGMLVSSFFS